MKYFLAIPVLALLLLAGAPAQAGGMEGMEMSGMGMPSTGAAAVDHAVVRVEASKVCMVNNNYMGTAQIPVKVDGKTYYGCCEMCKGILRTKAEARHAVDPVSGKSVDKATAVIGKASDGKVVYFSSLAHLKSYQAGGSI